jgi:hypothetical protein
MTQSGAPPVEDLTLRIGMFRVPEDSPGLHAELRALADPPWGRCRWIGRRLMDDHQNAEILVVTLWDGSDEMDREVAAGQARLSETLRLAAGKADTEIYTCRAYGAWPRDEEPSLIRIFRGQVVEGDPDAFDAHAASLYLANFAGNSHCVSVAAAVRSSRDVVLATLWTDWDAIVSSTGGDIGQVLPISLPGWAVAGSAVHYEIVAAESR